MSDVDANESSQDNLRDAEPVYSSETPHFDALVARYDVGNEWVPNCYCSYDVTTLKYVM